MHVLVVEIHVKEERLSEFITATLDNAQNSVQEPGCLRFDVMQSQDQPTRFTLYEVYHRPEDALTHKETEHYLRWRSSVEDMMAQPRVGKPYSNVFPTDDNWN